MILEAGLGEPGYDPMLEYQPDQGLVSNNCLFSEKKRNKQFLAFARVHIEGFFIVNTAQSEAVSAWNCFLQIKQIRAEVRGKHERGAPGNPGCQGARLRQERAIFTASLIIEQTF